VGVGDTVIVGVIFGFKVAVAVGDGCISVDEAVGV